MNTHRPFTRLVILGLIGFVLAGASTLRYASAATIVYTDFASFEAATDPLTEIDFENLPDLGSSDPGDDGPFVPNPFTLDGVLFSDPFELNINFCSSPTCQADPDNPDGGNLVLSLNQDATIDLPVGTGGVMLVVEGLGNVPFTLQVTDFDGGTSMVNSQGILFDAAYVGVTSTSGIQQIKIVSVGPTANCPQSPCGPLPISTLFIEFDDPDVTTGAWIDTAGDVTPPNADIRSGSAIVSDDLLDLRIHLNDAPFRNGHVQEITWCLDTDQNAVTGNACGTTGADQEFTIAGYLGSLYGGDVWFEGTLDSIDPCDVGWFNWDSNTLRLIIPLDLLLDDGAFNYAAKGVFRDKDQNNNEQIHSDDAPDTIDFGSTAGYYASFAANFAPFNGTRLCSANNSATISVPIQTSGTIELFPELGILRNAPVAQMIQSTYFKTTSTNRQFRRGFFEMTIPELPEHVEVSNATLILTESRARTTFEKPAVTHELAYYQPADLIINTQDYTRTATLLDTFETDENLPTDVFSLDVTDVFDDLHSDTLGFRVKLALDPSDSVITNYGSAFGEPSTIPPRLLIRVAHAHTKLDSGQSGTLIYTDTQGLTTTVSVAAGTVTDTTTLAYTAITTTNSIASALNNSRVVAGSLALMPLNRGFSLDAYQAGARRSASILQHPITVTVHYSDADVILLNEATLTLNAWNGSQWEYAACGLYDRHPDHNWLAVPICQLSEFDLFAKSGQAVKRIYLPAIAR